MKKRDFSLNILYIIKVIIFKISLKKSFKIISKKKLYFEI